jgi:transposase
LSEGQRAVVGANIATAKKGSSERFSNVSPKPPIGGLQETQEISRKEAAKVLNVSSRSIDRAARIKEHGTEELNEAVANGTVSLGDAESVVNAEPEVQKEAIEAVKKGEAKTVTEAILCERCKRAQRVGQEVTKNCPMCKELRGGRPVSTHKKSGKQEKEAPVDAFGVEIPKRCRAAFKDPWIQDAIDTIAVVEEKIRKARLADGMQKRAKHYPFFVPKDFVDGVGFVMNNLDDLLSHLKRFRPAAVCPDCEGKGCATCRLSGWVPREIYENLQAKR